MEKENLRIAYEKLRQCEDLESDIEYLEEIKRSKNQLVRINFFFQNEDKEGFSLEIGEEKLKLILDYSLSLAKDEMKKLETEIDNL